MTYQEIEEQVIVKAMQDEEFRRQLIAEPKATIERQLGASLPEGLEIRVVEESPDVRYLVLPPLIPEGELTDEELDVVSGGYRRYRGTAEVRQGSYLWNEDL